MTQIPFDSSKKLVCVEYPGIAKNIPKVLETLGGLETISRTVADPSRRLELRLRPKDVYCKPACADHSSTNNLVLRIRRKKKKQSAENVAGTSFSSTDAEEPFEASVVGIVDKTYKFQSMCDFQYLPAKSNVKRVLPEDGGEFASTASSEAPVEKRNWESMTQQLFVGNLVSSSWLKQPVPLFLPPPIFSRQDTPVEYLYRPEPKHRPPKCKDKKDEAKMDSPSTSTEPISPNPKAPWKAVDEKDLSACKDNAMPNTNNLIGVARQRRAGYTIFVNFEDELIPDK